jgi:hypothetical protein
MNTEKEDSKKLTPAVPIASRLNRAFGPVAAGILLDLLDIATFGPIGLLIGLPVGAAAGWWMAGALGIEKKNRKWFALAAAVYCAIPFTELIPLATLTGACVRFKQSGREPIPEPKQPPETESSG